MIPRIRAVAIDDDAEHLKAICDAAVAADIVCRKIHYPHDINEKLSQELINHQIRLVICDLHLQADGAMGDNSKIFATVGSLLETLGIQPWTPYVMLLWTKDAGDTQKIDEFKKYLEQRVDPKYLPSALISLDKTKYGIPGTPTQEQTETLWSDLREKVQGSRGLNLLLQWESELYRAAGRVACNLIATARNSGDGNQKIDIDDEVDKLLSRIARAATSDSFAKEHFRSATVEGLLPLVSDEMLHLSSSKSEIEIWRSGLQNATESVTLDNLSLDHAATLNAALHIAQDGSTSRAERGTVFECTEEQASKYFGIQKNSFNGIFGIKGSWPKNAVLRCIQVEGACDAARRKKGVMVPILLAAEIDARQNLMPKGEGIGMRPLAVEETPPFSIKPGKEGSKILVANVRYYITLERSELEKELQPAYRLRESLVSKLAFAWATHVIRPGIVSFDFEDSDEPKLIKKVSESNVASVSSQPNWFNRISNYASKLWA
jgi:hypothetical protein